MAAMPRLSLICCYGTGYERIDLAAARKRNIMVTHGADANAPDVAEMAVGILLASTRRIVRADKMIRRGDWTKRIPNRFGAIAGLSGGKVGILGLGAIGMEFVKRIKGFDVEIGYCNRSKRSDVDYRLFPQRHGARDLVRLPDRLPALGRLQPAHHQCRGAEGAGAARPCR